MSNTKWRQYKGITAFELTNRSTIADSNVFDVGRNFINSVMTTNSQTPAKMVLNSLYSPIAS